MYRLKLKDIPSFKFFIGKDFIVHMFRESRKNLPICDMTCDTGNVTGGGGELSLKMSVP